MAEFISLLVPFLAILNPFALCLYLTGVMEDLTLRDFARVMAGACLVALLAVAMFAVAGEYLLVHLLGLRFDALRVFGGAIFLGVGYQYVTKGYRATVALRGSVDELPSAIALPFMIGAGTITQSILIGDKTGWAMALATISAAVAVAFAMPLVFKLIRDHLRETRGRVFDRYVNILARVNGLIIGGVSTEMVITGARHLWEGGYAMP